MGPPCGCGPGPMALFCGLFGLGLQVFSHSILILISYPFNMYFEKLCCQNEVKLMFLFNVFNSLFISTNYL